MTQILIAAGVIYAIGVGMVFVPNFIIWIDCRDEPDDYSEETAARAARIALKAWIWPVLLLAVLGEMVQDAQQKSEAEDDER